MSTNDMFITSAEFVASRDMGYSKPKMNKAGGKSISILNKSTNRQLYLGMPLMLTWGVNTRTDEATGRVSYDMSLQFPVDEYATEQTKASLASIEAMEEQVKQDAMLYSKEWFNKPKLTDGQVDVLFNPMLYWAKDKDTGERREGSAPTLRVKLDCWDDKFNCEVYDVNKHPMYPSKDGEPTTPIDLITKGCLVATIIKCGGVYFVNGKFGVTWRLHQALVKPKPSMNGMCFIPLSPDEVTLLNSQRVKDDKADVEIVESDDEFPASSSTTPNTTDELPNEEDVSEDKKKKKVVKKKGNSV
jgi:hypothetical protein